MTATTMRPHDRWQAVLAYAEGNPGAEWCVLEALREVLQPGDMRGKALAQTLGEAIVADPRSADDLAAAYLAEFERLGGRLPEVAA